MVGYLRAMLITAEGGRFFRQ
uniref:Multidrug efflux system transporter n=1 Tax=mine drainage metagenome TaxID=410659 RepID=E6QEA3_9ZZZZ